MLITPAWAARAAPPAPSRRWPWRPPSYGKTRMGARERRSTTLSLSLQREKTSAGGQVVKRQRQRTLSMLARRCEGLLVPRRGRVLNEASVQVQVPRVPRHLQDVHTRESKWEKPLEIASEGERGVMRAREEKRKGPPGVRQLLESRRRSCSPSSSCSGRCSRWRRRSQMGEKELPHEHKPPIS